MPIDIVIPVYNAAGDLARCVESPRALGGAADAADRRCLAGETAVGAYFPRCAHATCRR
jgi:hypothetical protein